MNSENIVVVVIWQKATLTYTAVCRWPWATGRGGNGATWCYLWKRGEVMELKWMWGKRKAEVMRISRQTWAVQITVDQSKLENVEYFKHLVSVITKDEGVHGKLNPGFPWQKQHLTRRRLFTSKLYLNLWKKVVKCYAWRTALCGAEIWDTSESRWKKIPGKMLSVVLEKDGEDHSGRSCDRWSVTQG
jgi:hypothetical protein